jgi:2-polyprenyl-3-methyl-5-hydroxy-6-metoxy-1,4-benzoquinol methylase
MVPEKYSNLRKMLDTQLAAFPDHRGYLERRFENVNDSHLALADDLAAMVLKIAGSELDKHCQDYRWLSAALLDEELHFRRTGKYRLSSFAEANAQVYADREFMSRYMNGLLVSQLWWRNHTEVMHFYRDRFVKKNPAGFTHLEVGPGHGLFLYLAVASPNCKSAEGWDVSDASLSNTQSALAAMGAPFNIKLRKVNLFDAPNAKFSSIVCSEVLEHLEQPAEALRILGSLLTDDGRIFLNVPANSPAPDHIYLFHSPEEVVDMVRASGFRIIEAAAYPTTGASLERARKAKLTVSAAIIASKG